MGVSTSESVRAFQQTPVALLTLQLQPCLPYDGLRSAPVFLLTKEDISFHPPDVLVSKLSDCFFFSHL